MPANLTPQYQAAEARYRQASTNEEKIEHLQEMLRLLPKHKGTEKIFADLKRRLSKHQRVEVRSGSVSRRVPGEYVDSAGAHQVLLIGGPNAGKSALQAAVTHAKPDVAAYPYTTTHLAPAMMPIRDVQTQLVDGPALSREFARPWLKSQILACDLVLWVVSLGDDDLLDAVEDTLGMLEEWHIRLVPAEDEVPHPDEDDRTNVPALLVTTHADDEEASVRAELLAEAIPDVWTSIPVSTTAPTGLDVLAERVFEALHVVRVYTKIPHRKPDMTSPFLLDRGATVIDFAEAVHREIAEKLVFARIWGEGAYDGQRVQRDHVLCDGDIVELHGG
jgi:ribosome-interacting GTPase 1